MKNPNFSSIQFRKDYGMTQKEFANLIGVTQDRVSVYEKLGGVFLTEDALSKLFDIFGYSYIIQYTAKGDGKKYHLLDIVENQQKTIESLLDKRQRLVRKIINHLKIR